MQYFVESFGSLQRIDYGTGWSDAYRLHAGMLPLLSLIYLRCSLPQDTS